MSHHSSRSRFVIAFNVGRPAVVRPGAWVGSASRSGWRITIDRTAPSRPTALPAAGLSENAVLTASQTVSSSLSLRARHHSPAAARNCR